MVPAHQRLYARDLVAFQADDGLVEHHEFVAFDGEAEVAFQFQPFDDARVHLGFEDFVTAPSVLLPEIHRHVGVPQQLVRRLDAGLADGDADATADHRLAPLEHERLATGGQEPFRDPNRLLDGGHVLDQHRELVAAEARRRILVADDPADALGDAHQQLVARAVPQAVVHGLEVVEVQEQDSQRPGGAGRPRQSMREAVLQQGPVRQPGQRVVERLVPQLVGQGAPLGVVAAGQHEARHVRIVQQVGDDGLDLAPAAVRGASPARWAAPVLPGLRAASRNCRPASWSSGWTISTTWCPRTTSGE